MPIAVALCAGLLLLVAAPDGHCEPIDLQVLYRLPVGPGNITVTPDDRIILSLHPFHSPANKVVELARNGTLIPFPNASWNSFTPDGSPPFMRLDGGGARSQAGSTRTPRTWMCRPTRRLSAPAFVSP